MTFFESLVLLFAVAVLLLQVARRLALPYPSLLAAAGMMVAAIPGAPNIPIAPSTALALFIAPVLIDAAFDFPIGAARRLALPLTFYAVVAVLVSAGAVALIGHVAIGLPIAAALTLGAIVAPPDVAAATAVLSRLPVAREVDAVLKGESLFNDATALLLFSGALAIQTQGSVDGGTALHLALAVPGGILFGIAYGYFVRLLQPLVDNSVGGTLSQFVTAFAVWLIAERLHLSAVLATVASAMTIAAGVTRRASPRMRVHSYAVWTTVVFLLNVLAFLLMGMQARRIFGSLDAPALLRAGRFAGLVVLAVIATRMAMAFAYRGVVVWRHRRHGGPAPIAPAETMLVGWAGMRGLLTMATAFALPDDFPERDTVVLVAFAVVLATLVIQGLTLHPMIRWFGLAREQQAKAERRQALVALADAGLERLAGEPGETAASLRASYLDARAAFAGQGQAAFDHRRGLVLAAVLAQRSRLEALRDGHAIGADDYLQMQEDLDWKQLSVLGEEDRRLDES